MGQRVSCASHQSLSFQELGGYLSLLLSVTRPGHQLPSVLRTENPEFHPNPINSQNLPRKEDFER